MVLRIRAHYDGKTFVPDEPVDLPVGEQVEIVTPFLTEEEARWDPDKARATLREFMANPIKGLSISDQSLRREHLYEERL
mgnify:CR=1 FL=1